jgi:hypothetical protein
LGGWCGTVTAIDNAKVQTAESLATLFRACRQVVSDKQTLINNAAKGDKDLRGPIIAAECKEIYKINTGKDVPDDADHNALLMSVTDVITRAQSLINDKGRGFKGFLPAIFAKQLADEFTTRRRGKAYIKLTSTVAYSRNRANRPDEWEAKVIQEKFLSPSWKKDEPFAEEAQHKGAKATRVIIPEYYNSSCLACHGDPKGSKDITGAPKEGAKEGELGGAVSIAIY